MRLYTAFRSFALFAVLVGGPVLDAQQPAPPPPPGSPGSFDGSALEHLSSEPSSHTSFTFDRSMLQAADSWLASNSPEAHRVMAGLNSITVSNYRFRRPTEYDPAAMQQLVDTYSAGGWKHLVNANGQNSNVATDLWLHFRGAEIDNLVVLTRGARDMSFISVDCILRPLDMLHLSGHFGIPKVDSNAVMVPAK